MMKRIICLLLALLMAVLAVGCKKEDNSDTDAEQTSDTSESTVNEYVPQSLDEFSIIRSDDASDSLVAAVKQLNATIKELCGKSLPLYTDFAASEEKDYEIVIGSAKRDVCAELDALGTNEYVIKTVGKSGGATVLVGGDDDDSSVLAVYEFESSLKNLMADGDENMEIPMINQKGSTLDLAIDKAVLENMVMIQPSDVEAKVGVAARYFKEGINATTGKKMQVYSLNADADISNYPNAIVIGAVGKEANAIKNELEGNSYTVRVVSENGGTRIYLVGSNDISTMRAVQYYYSKAVVNGVMRLPKYFDATITSFVQRDPCIVPYEGKYYMYTSHNKGYGVRVSEDLLTWSSAKQIFEASWMEGFTGDTNFWAPECHIYNGKFYLFATYHSTDNNHRGVSVFRCNTPDGKFELISKRSADAESVGHITPADWDAIDGTLYVDGEGKPWMVFVYEWTSTSDGIGRMAYAPLSDDLTHFTAEPQIMFKANDPAWTSYKVTDGPWMYTCEDGTLLMIWSNMGSGGYAVGVAVSSNGRLDGTWTQQEKALVTGSKTSIYSATEGGHGMLFRDFDGRLYLAIHTPNSDDAALTLIPMVEKNGMLYLDTVN